MPPKNYKTYLPHIKRINWYKQGGAIRLFYVFFPFYSINETIGYDRNILYQKGEVNTAFFDRDRERAKALWVMEQAKKDKRFIDCWIADWAKKNKKALVYAEKARRKPVDVWSDQELVIFVNKFSWLTVDHWKKGVLIEWTDPDGEKLLNQAVKEFGLDLTPQEIGLLTSLEKLTFSQEEFLSRVKIIKKKKAGRNISADLTKHAQNFHWYHNNWAYVHDFDAKYFHRLIKEDSRHFSQVVREEKKLLQQTKKIKKAKIILAKNKRIPSELKNIFYLFTRLAEWRDLRKKMATALPNHYLYPILKRLAKENKISEALVGGLTFSEIIGWKLSDNLIKILKKRLQGSIFLCEKKGQCQWFYGDGAQALFKVLLETIRSDVIKGVVANQGIARGKVKIIETKEDFAKMKSGDILVAQMTRPEYLPLIKKAGAIVTDEGGLTSHAAIISRELNKPCIINTQVATEVLKDGDLVEVDAERGVVKVLKKAI